MALIIPPHSHPRIEQFAQAQQITTGEELDRILEGGLEQRVPSTAQTRVSYAPLFGAAKNGYGSREAVDRAIAAMRDEW